MKQNLICCENFICGNILFDTYCTTEQKNELRETVCFRHFKRNDILFSEGQQAQFVFVICKGKVKLWKKGINTHDQIIMFASEGKMIGFRGCIQDSGYFLSSTTIEDTEICLIPKDVFKKIITENHELNVKILWDYIIYLEKIEKRLRNMAEMNVREKTADAILQVIHEFGYMEDQETVNSTLNRRDFACLAGISTDRIVRQFSQFKKEKLIDFNSKELIISNYNGLKKIVESYQYL